MVQKGEENSAKKHFRAAGKDVLIQFSFLTTGAPELKGIEIRAVVIASWGKVGDGIEWKRSKGTF